MLSELVLERDAAPVELIRDRHGGINIEIDAPPGVQVTVHLNDGLIADETVPSS